MQNALSRLSTRQKLGALVLTVVVVGGALFLRPERPPPPLPSRFGPAVTVTLKRAVKAQEEWREEHGTYADVHDGLSVGPAPGSSASVIYGSADTYCIQGGDSDGDHAHVTAEEPHPVPGFCPDGPPTGG